MTTLGTDEDPAIIVAKEPTDSDEVTDDAVVKAALDCIRRTIDEIGGKKTWKIRSLCREQDRAEGAQIRATHR